MEKFFGDDFLLDTPSARALYAEVRDLPVIDYHCHLDQRMIERDDKFDDIGELWLAGDHYKWRAMRLCGVDERLITGDASWKEKFMAYASIMDKLIGNPLYFWSHLELRQIFGIDEPLSADNAESVYERANAKLRETSVRGLLKKFRVEYIATADDPAGDLSHHGTFDGITVAPTFRPDRCLALDEKFFADLEKASGIKTDTLEGCLKALENRLDHFQANNCRISDHGFRSFPTAYADEREAAELYARRSELCAEEKDKLFGFFLCYFTEQYAKRGMLMQIHISVTRNINSRIFAEQGVDRGCDVFVNEECADRVIAYFDRTEGYRPETVLYSLNPNAVPMLATITGAYRRVKMGAAWWFNDTVEGIMSNFSQISEYAVLGTNYGMLTDSRSFSSYSRFDLFRRLLCSFVGDLAGKGACDFAGALKTVKNICYYNIKNQLGI